MIEGKVLIDDLSFLYVAVHLLGVEHALVVRLVCEVDLHLAAVLAIELQYIIISSIRDEDVLAVWAESNALITEFLLLLKHNKCNI